MIGEISFAFSLSPPTLLPPVPNTFVTTIVTANAETSHLLLIQTPACTIHFKDNRHIDLQFPLSSSFLDSIEKLENVCRHKIAEKATVWFDDTIGLPEIEDAFIPSIKVVSGTMQQATLRTQFCDPVVFDANGVRLPKRNDVAMMEDVKCLLHVEGVKFTSSSFQLRMTIKQIKKCVGEGKGNDNHRFLEKCLVMERENGDDEDEDDEDDDEDKVVKQNAVENEDNKVAKQDDDDDDDDDIDIENINDSIEEINVDASSSSSSSSSSLLSNSPLRLRKPKEVYMRLFNAAEEKYNALKAETIQAYREMQSIKDIYL